MVANHRNIVKILLLVLDADSETQLLSSKIQLASMGLVWVRDMPSPPPHVLYGKTF